MVLETMKKKVSKIATGSGFTACLTEDNEVYTWGYSGTQNTLGLKNGDANMPTPQLVEMLQGRNISDIVCGGGFCFALAT
jgi:alpha-tubulin suppressor-like RCC1 family protein